MLDQTPLKQARTSSRGGEIMASEGHVPPPYQRLLLSYCQWPTEPSMHLVNTEDLVISSSVKQEHEAIPGLYTGDPRAWGGSANPWMDPTGPKGSCTAGHVVWFCGVSGNVLGSCASEHSPPSSWPPLGRPETSRAASSDPKQCSRGRETGKPGWLKEKQKATVAPALLYKQFQLYHFYTISIFLA